MNFEFPISELPAVMRGPRVERRRALVGGSAFWGTLIEAGPDAGRLQLGRRPGAGRPDADLLAARQPQQDHCRAYLVQLAQLRDTPEEQADRVADVFHQAAYVAERAWGANPQARRLPVPELRRRVCRGDRQDLPQCHARRGVGLHRRFLPRARHGPARTFAIPTRVRCCA